MHELKTLLDINNNIKLWLVLDNIRSAYNVGAMFRTADGTGQTGLILLGITPTPEKHPHKIQKTALGAQNTVPYVYYKQTEAFLNELKMLKKDKYLGALELTSNSYDLFDWYPDNLKTASYFIAVGHELLGVSSKILVASEFHLYIPMEGYKESLNVAESATVLMYEMFRKIHYSK